MFHCACTFTGHFSWPLQMLTYVVTQEVTSYENYICEACVVATQRSMQ